MRYKIQNLENGGGFRSPTFFLEPSQSTTSVSSDKTGSKESSGLLDDVLYKELATKGGLVNDVNKLVSEISDLEQTSTNPFLSSNNRSLGIKLIGKINELRQNKNLWNSAVAHAKESGGLGEVAVGSSNEVYTKGENNTVKAISLEDYKKSDGTIKLLSVAELLNERQYNPNLVGQNSIFNVADNSIGLNKITDRIKDLINALGTEKESSTTLYNKKDALNSIKNLSSKEPSESEKHGLNILKQVVESPGNYSKIDTATESERNHVDLALNYIWKTLGSNAQAKLKATAYMNGENDPKDFIKQMLISETNISQITNVTPVSDSTATGKDKNSYQSLTNFQLFHNDKLMSPNTTFAVNDPTYSAVFRGAVGGVSPIITPKGQTVGMTSIKTILQNVGYNQFLKGDNVWFGNKKVNSGDLPYLIYDGADAAKVYMPVGKDGQPDYKEFANFKNVYSVFEANKDKWSPVECERWFAKNHYNIKIDIGYENGNATKIVRDNSYVKPFLLMYAYTNDATDLIDGNEKWLHKLSDSEESVIPELESIWTVGKGKDAKNMTPNTAFNSEDYYKGMVAIPYKSTSNAIINAMVGQGQIDKIATNAEVFRNINYSNNQPLNIKTSSLDLINK